MAREQTGRCAGTCAGPRFSSLPKGKALKMADPRIPHTGRPTLANQVAGARKPAVDAFHGSEGAVWSACITRLSNARSYSRQPGNATALNLLSYGYTPCVNIGDSRGDSRKSALSDAVCSWRRSGTCVPAPASRSWQCSWRLSRRFRVAGAKLAASCAVAGSRAWGDHPGLPSSRSTPKKLRSFSGKCPDIPVALKARLMPLVSYESRAVGFAELDTLLRDPRLTLRESRRSMSRLRSATTSVSPRGPVRRCAKWALPKLGSPRAWGRIG